MDTPPPARAAEAENARLRDQAAAATLAAQDAYRDTARLIRLLTVVGEPSSAAELVERTLDTLSEVFAAAVACLLRFTADEVHILASCGVAEDQPLRSRRVPPSEELQQLLSRPGSTPLRPDLGSPAPAISALGPRHVAWAPLGEEVGTERTLVVLYRLTDEPFGDADVQTLGSVVRHLHESLEAAEQRAALDRLARLGQRLARHLELEPLLHEAADLLRDITGADSALVATVSDGELVHRATSGADAGWPAPTDRMPAWQAACEGRAQEGPAAGPARTTSELCLPVLRDGHPVALLHVLRAADRPFPRHVREVVAVLADHLGAALTNAHLYRALSGSEANLRLITDAISDMVAVVDPAGVASYASPSFERELGLRPETLVGRAITDFLHPEHRARFAGMVAAADRAPVEDFRFRSGRDTWVWVETACRRGPSAGSEVVLSSRVIDQRKELEGQLRHRATHDPLTGLANRELVRSHLESALTEGSAPVGLLFCDLDHFKSVNDRLGHVAGDQLLQQVSSRLQRCVRDGDLLARLGGDEFVMVLRHVASLDDVDSVGRRVLGELSAPFAVGGEQLPVSASVGGVLGTPGGTTAEALLRDADAAMYDAKGNGRGRLAVFDDAAARRSLDRLALRSDVVHALERRELSLHYQPIVALDTGELLAFEALLRWTHPRLGPVPPHVFVPLAEETGAIVPIGAWVLAEAARQLARWRTRPAAGQLRMSLNLSVVELGDPGLAGRALDAVRSAGVDPGDVSLEITEDRSLSTAAVEQVRQLRRAGFRLALDDFGTLQSNFDRLRQFPVDHVKIDRSFVAGLGEDPVDQAAVRAIMVIGEALGLDVVAEGVETEQQRQALITAGCRLGQGYLFSRALPADAAGALLGAPVRAAVDGGAWGRPVPV